MKRTKIVATIGPASSSYEIIKEMVQSGVNVARINFSHGTHESNGSLIENVKKVREELEMPLGIMGDLQGPRIRVSVENNLGLKKDDEVLIFDKSLDKSEIRNPK